jgi:DNA (cytosine-5)-methyltransferase 1
MPSAANAPPNRGRAIELCCGFGGIGIGLRALGFSVSHAYDSWAEAVAIHNHNVPGDVAVECNVLTGVGRRLIAEDRKRMDDLEILAAGPPCKGFSRLQNGFHDGRNGQNRVLAAMPDYVALLRPRLFLIENVPDLERHRGGKTMAGVLSRLQQPKKGLKYRVSHAVFDAAQYGTPQARKRLLILGVRAGEGEEVLPNPGPDLTPLFSALRHGRKVPPELTPFLAALADAQNDQLTSASQALSDLELLDPGSTESTCRYKSVASTAFQRWVRLGAGETVSQRLPD